MIQARAGDTVHMHDTGTLADGTVFDSSEGRHPRGFKLGAGLIIPGLRSIRARSCSCRPRTDKRCR